MKIFDWPVDRCDEIKSARKLRDKNKWLCDIVYELFAALVDLLGDRPDIQSGICIRCCRDYRNEPELEGADCPSDDCPGYQARQLCARAKAGAL